MIGETIKIGFDGQQVTKGLGGIMGGFRKLRSGIGSVMKETGRGAALTLGNSLFNAVSNLAMAIPNELKSLAELNTELESISATTGMTAENFIALRQAVSRTTGKGMEDAGDDVRDFAERIEEASRDWDSSPAQAFRELNIFPMDLAGRSLDEQIGIIGEKVQAFEDKYGKGKSIYPLRTALGDEPAKWIPLFQNIREEMDKSRKDTEGFASQMKDAKKSFIDLGSAIKTSVVTAFTTLRGAIIATGIGALVVTIGFLLPKIMEWIDGTKELERKQNDLNRQIDKIYIFYK